jgi:hypothetical protein
MGKVRFFVVLLSIFILATCATPPRESPPEDPHKGELQGQVDGFQKSVAEKDATTNGWEMGTVISNYAIVKGVISNEYNYTVCAWVNPNTTAMISAGANGCILSDDGNNSVYPQTRDFIFSYVYTSQKWRLLVFGNVGASVYSASALTASNAVNGVWQHISGVCDYASSNIFIYYNGVLSGSNSLYSAPYWLTPNKSSAGSSCFGQLSYLPTYGPTKYNGMIDKIRFYGTAKDAAFIQYLFNSEKASKGL